MMTHNLLSKRDAESFGKVLMLFGKAIKTNPELLVDLFQALTANVEALKDEKENNKPIRPEIREMNLFDYYQEYTKEQIETSLSHFNSTELKFLMQKFGLGTIRSTSSTKLVSFIADQLAKRALNVFSKQE